MCQLIILLSSPFSFQEVQKKNQVEGNRLNQQIRTLNMQVTALTQANSATGNEKKNMETEIKKLTEDSGRAKTEVESLTKQLEDLKKELNTKSGEVGKMTDDLRTTIEQLNEHKSTVKQVPIRKGLLI